MFDAFRVGLEIWELPMVGQMTALLIGDAAFRAELDARDLPALGLRRLGADDFSTADRLIDGPFRHDIHVILLQVPADEAMQTLRLRQALALPLPGPIPVVAIGPGSPAPTIRAGAFHHLPPDYSPDLLSATVEAATKTSLRCRQIGLELRARSEAFGLIASGVFHFRTPDKANDLAIALSSISPQPQRLTLGLLELMLNAIEHGNLEIGAQEKSRLRAENRFAEEVERRLALPEYRDRWASLQVENEPGRLTFTIVDCGKGFDWRSHDATGISAPVLHGRGILLARTFGFDQVRYEGCGNRVVAITEWTADRRNDDAPDNG